MVSQMDGSSSAGGSATSPVTGAIMLHHDPPNEIEWTLPKAFLYSLTVLTTIGKGCGVWLEVDLIVFVYCGWLAFGGTFEMNETKSVWNTKRDCE